MGLSPEFTAVIPAFNAAPWIADAVESALCQRGVRVEVIVVDDGSTDGTLEVLARYRARVRVVRQGNQGVARARNCGSRAAKARWLAFLDADDTWAPEKLAVQRHALAATPGAAVCSTAFRVVDESGREIERRGGQSSEGLLERLLFRGNVIGTPSTVVCDRALFLSAGGFDAALSQCADWEMWLRLALRSSFAVVPAALASYRLHPASMSQSIRLLEADSLRTLDKAFGWPELPASLRARRSQAYAWINLVLAGSYLRAGQHRDALRCAGRSLALSPRGIGRIVGYPLRQWRRR